MHNSKHISVWQFIQTQLRQGVPVALLYVVESDGSSPGRRGFHLAATTNACVGTIGGGVMEFKLVEVSRRMIMEGNHQAQLFTQYHDKEHTADQSGMICSGMQRVTIILLNHRHETIIEEILSIGKHKKKLCITPTGISLEGTSERIDEFIYENDASWRYVETLDIVPRIHIIGAGHVSQALSELMARLGFYVLVYDDRKDLNTFLENQYAHEKYIVDYAEIGDIIIDDADAYIVIMTIGYRIDKAVLMQLIDKQYYYLGMLGSKAKIQTLFSELTDEGYTKTQLAKVHAPIGLAIHSKTAYEIAVSIAAEIIGVKNKPTPTRPPLPGQKRIEKL